MPRTLNGGNLGGKGTGRFRDEYEESRRQFGGKFSALTLMFRAAITQNVSEKTKASVTTSKPLTPTECISTTAALRTGRKTDRSNLPMKGTNVRPLSHWSKVKSSAIPPAISVASRGVPCHALIPSGKQLSAINVASSIVRTANGPAMMMTPSAKLAPQKLPNAKRKGSAAKYIKTTNMNTQGCAPTNCDRFQVRLRTH